MFNNYYELKIEGKDVKRFLKQLYKMNIYFENIQYKNQYVCIKVNKDNYEKIKKVKTIYKIKINKLYGLNKIKDMFHLMKYLFLLNKYRASLSLLKEITDISDTLDCLILRKEIYSSTNNLFFTIKNRC